MIFKIEKNNFQLLGMILISFLIQILGLYKTIALGNNLGSGEELDAYNFCNNIVTFILTLISTGVTVVVLPSYVRKCDRKIIDGFITAICLVTVILLSVIYFFRHQIVCCLTNRSDEFISKTNWIMIFSIIIQGVSAFLSVTLAFYQASNKFIIPKIIQFAFNLIMVAALICYKEFTLQAYLYIVTIFTVMQFGCDIVIAYICGFRYKPNFKFSDKGVTDLLKIYIPTVLSSSVYQISLMTDSLITSNLTVGALTILNYANLIVNVFNSLIVGNLTVYAYPKIVKETLNSDYTAQESMWRFALIFHSIICLLAAGYFSVGENVLIIFFGNGKFDFNTIHTIYTCSAIYVFGQTIGVIRDLIYKFFYAKNDNKTPMYNSINISILNIIISIILAKFFYIYGVVFGTVITGLLSFVFILINLKQKFRLISEIKYYFKEAAKSVIAVFVSIFSVMLTKTMFELTSQIVMFFIYGTMTVVIYMLTLFFLKSSLYKMSKHGTK